MIVALDYDGTITGDPEAFWLIAGILRQRGHKVYIVTMRYPSECSDIFLKWSNHVDGIYATGRQAKQAFMLERNHCVGVWIDDNPRAIHESAQQIWGTASAEGTVIIEDHNHGMLPQGEVSLEAPPGDDVDLLTVARYSLLRLAITIKRNYFDHPDGRSDPVRMFHKLQHSWWEVNGLWFIDEVAAHSALALQLDSGDSEEGTRYSIVVPPALAASPTNRKREDTLRKNMQVNTEYPMAAELVQRCAKMPQEISEMLKELKNVP